MSNQLFSAEAFNLVGQQPFAHKKNIITVFNTGTYTQLVGTNKKYRSGKQHMVERTHSCTAPRQGSIIIASVSAVSNAAPV